MKLVLIGNSGNLYSALMNGLGSCVENEVYLTKDLYSAWTLMSGLIPDFIIIDCETVSKNIKGIIKDLKTIHPNASLIIIADNSSLIDKAEYKNFGADIILDETMDIEPLIEFFVKIKRSKMVMEILKNKLEVLN